MKPDLGAFQTKLEQINSILPEGSRLLIVTKQRTLGEIQAYYELGHRDFGENRVQDLEEKAHALKVSCPDIRWHMIGHLQTNKINHLFKVPGLYAIHSVHDQQLLDKLIRAEDKLPGTVEIFLQVNTSHEEEKSGLETYTELKTAAQSALSSKKLKFVGLMTMGKIRTFAFEAEARRCFQELNLAKDKLENDLRVKLLTSMGMSQDYQLALEERSNWIRIGSLMFE